jgi:putative acetyltransferase
MTEAEPAVLIRGGTADGVAQLAGLYRAAFPDEDLLPLLRELLALESGVLALEAAAGAGLVGHLLLTRCAVAGAVEAAWLLGPLAVAPARQRQGIGTALVREGLRLLSLEGVAQVQVLGDPAYYGRFGFVPDRGVAPPHPFPEAWRPAWQARRLRPGEPLAGALLVPAPWRRPELWAP